MFDYILVISIIGITKMHLLLF